VLLGIKRIYEKAQITDGKRVLIDRLWPRGVKKSVVNIDLWLKDVAPSNELRKWFSHDPSKWEEFKKRYRKELENSRAFDQLLDLVKKSDVTLLYSSKEPKHNNAVALEEFIKERLR
jgi:uncharacterized protein YeaO (DUF488 family)